MNYSTADLKAALVWDPLMTAVLVKLGRLSNWNFAFMQDLTFRRFAETPKPGARSSWLQVWEEVQRLKPSVLAALEHETPPDHVMFTSVDGDLMIWDGEQCRPAPGVMGLRALAPEPLPDFEPKLGVHSGWVLTWCKRWQQDVFVPWWWRQDAVALQTDDYLLTFDVARGSPWPNRFDVYLQTRHGDRNTRVGTIAERATRTKTSCILHDEAHSVLWFSIGASLWSLSLEPYPELQTLRACDSNISVLFMLNGEPYYVRSAFGGSHLTVWSARLLQRSPVLELQPGTKIFTCASP
jgi:hypothetical protein